MVRNKVTKPLKPKHILCEEHRLERNDEGVYVQCQSCAALYEEFKYCNTEADMIAQIELYQPDILH